MIPFCRPSITELEKEYMAEAAQGKLCGDGPFTARATSLLIEKQGLNNALLTSSCTHALELAALLCDIKPGDEVILPSFTFSSTANAFLLRGAKLVFCEIDPRTMNMDPAAAEALVTDRTTVLAPIDYAGVPCDIDAFNAIAKKCNAKIVQDAAQSVGSKYKGRACGIDADFACYSFHETKNYVMGEGGAITFKSEADLHQAEIIREKGTDRSKFYRGEVDKYSWQRSGSSFLPSDILAALLCAQLERFDEIMNDRMHVWNTYQTSFKALEDEGLLVRPFIPDYAEHNAHCYYLILGSLQERNDLLDYLRTKGVGAVFHYIPLHSAPAGVAQGYKKEDLPLTEEYSGRLIRLPLFSNMSEADLSHIVNSVYSFFGKVAIL
ncbi:MAG: dTDP-4-amino-4,6-dideoxygalactose transaminase [Oscillospiraceae bacterium]|nr:dTDP-4-amino-4,6-dideoxygalactose transaminase [Oscillospiraceae bacterium]MBR0451046.1 dTDP-4-amino-4,6-dideoxygalactose transaminase [Oscillospiraceae bacterium]